MSDIGASRYLNDRANGREAFVVAFIASVLTAVIFYVDTFTTNDNTVSVLYMVAILFWGDLLSKRVFRTAALGALSLTLLSFAITNETDRVSAFVHLAVSTAAQLITTFLVLRNKASLQTSEALNSALSRSETRYRTIFEESRVALWERDYSSAREFLRSIEELGVTDFRNEVQQTPSILATCRDLVRTVRANRAARDLSKEILSASGTNRLLEPDDEAFIHVMEALFEQQKDVESTVRVKAHSGEMKLILVSLRFPEDIEAFDRVVVGMMDITKHELAQRALIEAQSVLAKASRTATVGILSASLAHDLNQPLSAILMNGQTGLRWLSRSPPDLERLERSVERIIRDCQRAMSIIQSTRESLLEAAKPCEQIDLEALLGETRALMKHELQNAEIELDIDVATEARIISGARIEIQQVLINLVTNAVQAMQQAESSTKRIEIKTRRSNDNLCTITVRDYGPGISPANLPRLFDPFFTTKTSGMGLGLSICQRMIEVRGGKLTAKNSAGGGAIMEIILPFNEENTWIRPDLPDGCGHL